jgi:hypothetical protein
MALPASFWEFLSTPLAQAVIWCTVLVWIVLAGWYLVQWCREYGKTGVPSSEEYLGLFRQMYEDGDLSDGEFRTIRKTLRERRVTSAGASGDAGGDERGSQPDKESSAG